MTTARPIKNRVPKMLEPPGAFIAMEHHAGIPELYFSADMEAAIPLSGQVVGRIDDVKSAADIMQDTVNGFYQAVSGLTSRYTDRGEQTWDLK